MSSQSDKSSEEGYGFSNGSNSGTSNSLASNDLLNRAVASSSLLAHGYTTTTAATNDSFYEQPQPTQQSPPLMARRTDPIDTVASPMCGPAFLTKVLHQPKKEPSQSSHTHSARRNLFFRRGNHGNLAYYDDVISLEQELDTESESSASMDYAGSRHSKSSHTQRVEQQPIIHVQEASSLPHLVQFEPEFPPAPSTTTTTTTVSTGSVNESPKPRLSNLFSTGKAATTAAPVSLQPKNDRAYTFLYHQPKQQPLPTVTEEKSFDSECTSRSPATAVAAATDGLSIPLAGVMAAPSSPSSSTSSSSSLSSFMGAIHRFNHAMATSDPTPLATSPPSDVADIPWALQPHHMTGTSNSNPPTPTTTPPKPTIPPIPAATNDASTPPVTSDPTTAVVWSATRETLLKQQDTIRELSRHAQRLQDELTHAQRHVQELRTHSEEQQMRTSQWWMEQQDLQRQNAQLQARIDELEQSQRLQQQTMPLSNVHRVTNIVEHYDDEQDQLTKRFQLLMEDQVDEVPALSSLSLDEYGGAAKDDDRASPMATRQAPSPNVAADNDRALPVATMEVPSHAAPPAEPMAVDEADTSVLHMATSWNKPEVDPVPVVVYPILPRVVEQPPKIAGARRGVLFRLDDTNSSPMGEPPRIVKHAMMEPPEGDVGVASKRTSILHKRGSWNDSGSTLLTSASSSLSDSEIRLNLVDCMGHHQKEVDAFKHRLDKIQKKRLQQKGRDMSGPAVRFA